jgi:hypothetical protein
VGPQRPGRRRATLRWRGRDWTVAEPRLVGLADAAPALGRFNAAVARRVGIDTYLRVSIAPRS